jgi:hypothetical protein
MILGDHRQETEKESKKSKKELTRLDWDINTGHCTVYTLAGWIGTSTRPRALYTQTTTGTTKRNCSSTQQTTHKQLWRTTLAETTAERKTKGQAAPHQTDHRHAGPNATELLQPNRPPDDVKTTETEATHSRVRGDHQPATQHASLVRGDLKPAARLTLRTRLLKCRRRSSKRCPAPRSRYKSQTTIVTRNHDVASSSRKSPPSS